MAAWWPAVPFKDLVTADGERFSLTGPAAAWLFLAPVAEMPVTDEQWAQLAGNPVIYELRHACATPDPSLVPFWYEQADRGPAVR